MGGEGCGAPVGRAPRCPGPGEANAWPCAGALARPAQPSADRSLVVERERGLDAPAPEPWPEAEAEAELNMASAQSLGPRPSTRPGVFGLRRLRQPTEPNAISGEDSA